MLSLQISLLLLCLLLASSSQARRIIGSKKDTGEFNLEQFLKKILESTPIFESTGPSIGSMKVAHAPAGSLSAIPSSNLQGEECKDEASWCPQYVDYCSQHATVQQYCKKTCKKCPISAVVCKDIHHNCADAVKWGYCTGSDREVSFMRQYCQKSCKYCNEEGTNTCKDEQSTAYCLQIKIKGYCTHPQYKSHFMNYCKKSCNFCEECGIAKQRKLSTQKLDIASELDNNFEIVGGVNAVKGYYPWQVAIYYDDNFICGGSLISQTDIVTAAHCFNNRDQDVRKYKVVLGDHNRKFNEGTEQTAFVEKITIHNDYSLSKDDHDIAMIRITTKAKLSNYISKICLPQEDVVLEPGTKCYLTGWGKTSHIGDMVDLLQVVQIPIAERNVCERRNAFNFHEVTDKMICGGYNDGANFISGCHGDSGGPLQCEMNGKWFLYGVVSWGSPLCNGLDRYTVFTRVSSYVKWIERNRS